MTATQPQQRPSSSNIDRTTSLHCQAVVQQLRKRTLRGCLCGAQASRQGLARLVVVVVLAAAAAGLLLQTASLTFPPLQRPSLLLLLLAAAAAVVAPAAAAARAA